MLVLCTCTPVSGRRLLRQPRAMHRFPMRIACKWQPRCRPPQLSATLCTTSVCRCRPWRAMARQWLPDVSCGSRFTTFVFASGRHGAGSHAAHVPTGGGRLRLHVCSSRVSGNSAATDTSAKCRGAYPCCALAPPRPSPQLAATARHVPADQ
jgi:hypothetical protein